MLGNALLEFRSLRRLFGLWLPLVLLLWCSAAWFQEPMFFRFAGIQLFWSGLEASAMVALAVIPLAWLAATGPAERDWILGSSRRPARVALSQGLGLLAYGAALAAVLVGLSFALDRIGGRPSSPVQALGVLGRLLLFLAPLAALAPGLASLNLSRVRAVVLWVAVLAATLLWIGGAGSAFDNSQSPGLLTAVLSPVLATAAGILLSTALMLRKTRNGPREEHAHRDPR